MHWVEVGFDTDNEEEYEQALEQLEHEYRVRVADWKVFAEEVLEKVDRQLEMFGLQVVQHDHGGDYYEWHIGRRAGDNEEEYDQSLEQSKRHHCDCVVNWRAFPDEVLEKIDPQLERFGLEIVQHFHGGDYYEWHIDKRLPGNNTPSPWADPAETEWLLELVGVRDPHGPGRGKERLAQWRKERRAYLDALKAKSDGSYNDGEYDDLIGPGIPVADEE